MFANQKTACEVACQIGSLEVRWSRLVSNFLLNKRVDSTNDQDMQTWQFKGAVDPEWSVLRVQKAVWRWHNHDGDVLQPPVGMTTLGTSETDLDRTPRGVSRCPGLGLLGEWGLQETIWLGSAGEGGPVALHLRSHYSNFSSPKDKKEKLEDCALS